MLNELHYSQAVKIGDRVETSGQGGWDDDLQIPESLADEIAQAFRNVERTLATAGAGWEHVVHVNSYHVGGFPPEVNDVMVADVQALVQKTVATYGKLDCAFNNAGIDLAVKPLHEQSVENFDKIMSINARGLFLCMKYEIQQMLTQGAGAIVNNSSTNGLVALPGISPYVASKHAVMGLTRSAALDYAKQGIRINAVNPGPIATDLMARSADQMGITFDDLGSMVPMGRIGQATEIAQAVVFLCSDAASYITGQPLTIDGGYTVS